MIDVRTLGSLGGADHGWLNTRHHFSFAEYYDPARMGWGALRVWNDDEIGPKSGFPPHPHRDMEIITYVREGAITHQDSMGNTGKTEAGDVQVMSAGTGVRHAEYNLEDGKTRLFQLWIQPSKAGGAPSWGARPFPRDDRAGRFVAWPRASPTTPTPCRSAPRRGSWARPSRPARRPSTRSTPAATPIWSRPRGG